MQDRFRPAAAVSMMAILATFLAPALARAAPAAIRFGADQSISSTSGTSVREVSVAANPVDPLNVVAGFVDHTKNVGLTCGWAFTVDGGQNWRPGGSVPLQVRNKGFCGADSSVAADLAGTFYYAYLDGQIQPQGRVILDIDVAKSTDGGRSFSAFSVLSRSGDPSIELQDKPYIAVDAWPKSPFKGTVYVSFTRAGVSTAEIRVIVSRDGGLTASSPVTISRVATFPTDEVQGSVPTVAPDGTVYVFYADYKIGTGPLSIKFSRSADGGQTWSPPADAASGLPSSGIFYLKNADPEFGVTASHGLLAQSFPTAAVAPDGTISVAWTDFPSGSCVSLGGLDPSCTNADVRLTTARKGGKSWSAPVKVSDDGGSSDQFLPWIAAHPNGLLSLVWMDRRLDPLNINYDAFYTNTTDARSFLPNVRVSSASSQLGTIPRIGEYPGIAVTGDGIFPAWPDMRFATSFDVFTAKGVLGP